MDADAPIEGSATLKLKQTLEETDDLEAGWEAEDSISFIFLEYLKTFYPGEEDDWSYRKEFIRVTGFMFACGICVVLMSVFFI